MSNAAKKDEIEDDVYRQFVRSVFANEHILLVGGILYFLTAAMVYLETGKVAFLLVAPILLAGNLWRYFGIRRFHKLGDKLDTVEDARRWEQDYILRGCAQGLAVGLFCFLAVYVYSDPYAEVVSVSIAVGSLITNASRNYGSPKMVLILTLGFVAPVAIAFMLRGDVAYAFIGLMLLPLVSITTSSARYVREVLFTAINGHKRADQLAFRFDRALNTMPQGLLMLDKSSHVLVANAEAAAMGGFKSTAAMVGRSMSSLVRRLCAAGLMSREDCALTARQLVRAMHDGGDRKRVVTLLDGRSFEITTREGANDLGIVMFEDVTERVRISEHISFMARFDQLTALPNRGHFRELVSQRLTTGAPDRNIALAMFDLDDFKGINDSLGHPAGDKVIETIGRRLAEHTSLSVIISRSGGDEFAVYFDTVSDQAELEAALQRIWSVIVEPVEVNGNPLRIAASGGAVMMDARSSNVDTLIVRADLALHGSKGNQRNSWALFEDGMEETFRLRERLKADLRKAIAERTLRVVYQPIIRLDTLRISMCEALCRWEHPEMGPIPPMTFIPLAEETGLIGDITTFVLEQACTDCATWANDIAVSVNLSAKDLADPGIVKKVACVLESSGIRPERLEVEMTETSLLDDKSAARDHAEGIRQLGVRIALDDFGTGYSSFSYLHRLPLDKLKIDRSFMKDATSDVRSLELVKSIVQLSHRLGMSVTVEGVETFDQLKLLSAEVRPDLVQGFLFGSALSASGIGTLSHTAWRFSDELDKMVARPLRRKAAVN